MVKKYKLEVAYDNEMREIHHFEVEENKIKVLDGIKETINSCYQRGLNGIIRLPKENGLVFINVKKTIRISITEETEIK